MALVISLALLSLGAVRVSAANDHSLPPPDVFKDVNPCTGDEVTITQTYEKAVFHLSADGTHMTGTANGTITTSDGFTGRFTEWFGGNSNGGASEGGDTFSATLKNGSGPTVVVHDNGHFTINANGDIAVSFENVSLECKGTHAV